MNRRRLLWFGIPLIALGGIVVAWFCMQRDADFVVVGPKTKGVRANFALLETTIDPADYRDCKTVQQAIARLNGKMRPPKLHRAPNWLRSDNHAFPPGLFTTESNTPVAPFEFPAVAEPITVKQFIRMTYAQSGLPDVAFIVRGHYIEVTTAKQAQEERTRYLDTVSVFDRMHHFWKEMTGTVEPDEPEWITVEYLTQSRETAKRHCWKA